MSSIKKITPNENEEEIFAWADYTTRLHHQHIFIFFQIYFLLFLFSRLLDQNIAVEVGHENTVELNCHLVGVCWLKKTARPPTFLIFDNFLPTLFSQFSYIFQLILFKNCYYLQILSSVKKMSNLFPWKGTVSSSVIFFLFRWVLLNFVQIIT